MSFYEKQFLPAVIDKRDKKINGIHTSIPFCFPGYHEFVDSIEKGIYYAIASGPGNGKSYLMRYMIYKAVEFALQTGYKLKILLFILEDSKMMVYKAIAAHYLWEHYKIYISKKVIDSKEEPIPQKFLDLLVKDVAFFKKFEEIVYIMDDKFDPDSITETCEKCHAKFGEEFHYFAIVDNYANIEKGEYKSKYEAVSEFSSKHVRLNLCKKLGFSFLAIIQNDMDSEKFAARNASGNVSAIEPNLGSFGDIKIITRDIIIIWALFNPWRYGMLTYPNSKGWNIDILRNKFRSLLMLKNNIGEMAPRLGLFFDGGKGIYTELPSVDNEEALRQIYEDVLTKEKQFRESRSKQ